MKITSVLISLCFFCTTLLGQSEMAIENCLTNNEYENRYASYSPNGERIVFESNRSGHWEIYLMDTDGMHVERLTNNNRINRRPSWHPKGKAILYESIEDGVTQLRTIKINGKKERIIKSANAGEDLVFAMYAPNGKAIAVSLKQSETTSNIILLNKRGKVIREITKSEYRNYYPKWSSDGNEIVYFSRKETANEDDEIYRINVESGMEQRLTNWPKHNFCPDWSSDDSQIVYVTSMEEVRPEIYIMDADGGNKMRITTNNDGDTLPNWHPSKWSRIVS